MVVMILFRKLWLLLTLVLSPGPFVMSRRQSAIAVLQSCYTCCTYIASSVFRVHLYICSTYLGQNRGRQASDTIGLPACWSYRSPQSLQLDWCWQLSATSDQPATVCIILCVYYQSVPLYVHVRVTWRAYSTVQSYVTRTHMKIVSPFTGQQVQCILLGLQPGE